MREKLLNKRRRDSLIAFSYKLAELFIAGVALAGIMDSNSTATTLGGCTVAMVCFAIGFYLEGD